MAKAKRLTIAQHEALDRLEYEKLTLRAEKAEIEAQELPPDIVGKWATEHPIYCGPRTAPERGWVLEAENGKITVETENTYGVKSRVILKAVIWE